MASSSFTSSSNSSLVSIVKALSCLLFLSFSSVFWGVTADTLSKNVSSSSAARKRDASSSSSSSAAARKREEDARVVDQLAANLMMNAGARMQNEKTPRNNGTFASSTRDANTGDTLDANNYASSPVRTRPDVDAAFLYRISGEMVSKMRARMPRELVERGDPVAEARYASARCEDSSGGIALNFIFDFFDALLDAAGFRAYDDQTNRMYQMHSRSNRSDGDSIVSTTREANAITENDDDENEAIPMINIEDAFYTRAKSFYLANKDEKENEERIHRALGKFEEGDAFAACPSEINAWTWLFSFFQLDLSSFGGGIGGSGSNGTNSTDNGEGVVGGTPGSIGTGGVTSSPSPSYSSNYDLYPPASSSAIIVGGIKKCTAKNCLYPRACCDVTQTGHLSCVAHFSMCPDFCGVSDDFKRCDSGPTKKAFTTEFIDSFVRFCCGEICCPTGYICCVAPEIVGHNGNKCAKKEICNQVRGVFVCFCNSVVFFIRVCILFFLSREKLLTR